MSPRDRRDRPRDDEPQQDAPRQDAQRQDAPRPERPRLDAVAQRADAVAQRAGDVASDARDRFSSRRHAMARYVAQRMVLKPTIWSITDVTVIDRDRLDGLSGGFVVVANHSSHLDAPLILGALPRRLARYLATGAAADYFFDVPWRRQLTELFFNAFPVQRGSGTPASAADATRASSAGASAGSTPQSSARRRAAARAAARGRSGQPTVSAKSLLQRGYPVLVFPEGTRSKDGTVGHFKPGAAALAVACDVPVVPLALIGAHIAHPRGANWPRPGRLPVGVAFGDPMLPAEGEGAAAFSLRVRAEVLRLRDANTARILGPDNPSEGAHR
ncbi:lysophospholipid acyltransferase family protein [Frigoribacterium sp. CFBP9030]|uniref:lysophospholipid acyltransferase family protein n=1 Tax=Frigoribacterium sp. CFBP9030 TaxID=3096537 RepID=UPI002A6ADB03|nr:lysophospholipid acyltransferase family protein [Frigoribacterium sp. CFBP9030]MDY0892667.1 lysophospholipid acyltransferase family protein [Frigoribacterium sp. CFBP9030]